MGCAERSLGEISQSGRVGGPRAGSVWASVGTLGGGHPSLAFLPRKAGKGSGPGSFRQGPSVSLLPAGVLGVSGPHPQHSPRGVSERTCSSWAQGPCSLHPPPELWRPLCDLGPSPPLRPWLSPHDCAHRGGCSPEAGLLPGGTTAQAGSAPCPHPWPGPTCGVLTGPEAGPTLLLLDRGPPGAGLSTMGVTVTQSPKSH